MCFIAAFGHTVSSHAASDSPSPRPDTAAAAAAYNPVTPYRVLDTREPDSPEYINNFPTFFAGQEATIRVAGPGLPIPSSARTVVVNLTVTNPEQQGFLSIFPAQSAWPFNRSVSFDGGQTIASLAFVAVQADGLATIRTDQTTDAIVDIMGYFTSDAGFTPVKPRVFLDTTGRGEENPLHAGSSEMPTIGAFYSLPVGAVDSVFVSLTSHRSRGPGFLTVHPYNTPRPFTSVLNFPPSVDRTAGVLIKTDSTNTISVYTHATTHLSADIYGYIPKGSSFTGIDPGRLVDTRLNDPARKPKTQSEHLVDVTGRFTVPESGVQAVAVTVTVTEADDPGFITVWDSGDRPWASAVNYSRGDTIANTVIVPVAPDGNIRLYAHGGTHFVVDILGYFD